MIILSVFLNASFCSIFNTADYMIYFILQTLQGALLSCTYTVLDYAQTGLIAAVFFFKVSKAWHFLMLYPSCGVNNMPKLMQRFLNLSIV